MNCASWQSRKKAQVCPDDSAGLSEEPKSGSCFVGFRHSFSRFSRPTPDADLRPSGGGAVSRAKKRAMSPVYCGLVHYPVLDRAGAEVATSITNMDVHDIARSARTFGLSGYYVVSPITAQYPVVNRIVEHWCEGSGRKRFPQRTEAIQLVRICPSVEDAIGEIRQKEGQPPRVLATSARSEPGREQVSYEAESLRLREGSEPALILFGTGHGLSSAVFERVNATLPPITGPTTYNHLSVRAAVAITLDRLFGE